MIGKTIRLFLIDGTATGLVSAEIMNWTGQVVAGPRSRLADMIARQEAGRSGVYFLTGLNPDSGDLPWLYIGESDDVGNRLKQHNKDENKDFWDRACFVTSKDMNLTKAHIKYLEARLINLGNEVGMAVLKNSTTPVYDNLPEADQADMEFFLQQLLLVLPVLGLDYLRVPHTPLQSKNTEASGPAGFEEFVLTFKKEPLKAFAIETDSDFIVEKGSQARSSWIGDLTRKSSYWKLRQHLIDAGKLVQMDDGSFSFASDVVFSSPSAAAAVIQGRTSNGRRAWKHKVTGKTYGEWQEGLTEASPGTPE